MKFSNRTFLLLLVVASERAVAFTSYATVPFPVSVSDARQSKLSATVISPTGEFEEDKRNSWLYEDETGGSDAARELASRLSREQLAQLVRLCVAYSPPDRALKLSDIEEVNILNIGESHIDIEAAVCENEGCVTLSVPVSFPKPCMEDDSMVDCVLDNLGQLDVEANAVLKEMQWAEENAEDHERLVQGSSIEDLHLPEWWVDPRHVAGMVQECYKMREVLNRDDFQAEVNAMVMQSLATLYPQDNYSVEKSSVIAICPAGMYLRAKVTKLQVFEESPPKVIDLTLQFEQEALDANSLQSAVLGAVASASSYAD